MSSTQTIQLQQISTPKQARINTQHRTESTEAIYQPSQLDSDEPDTSATNITTAIPDGGYGWVVVASCSLMTFWFNGLSGSWGVIQTALLSTSLPRDTPASTITFVGSLNLCLCVALGIFGVRLISLLGARPTALLGITLMGVGEIASGFSTSSIGGLFSSCSLVVGTGTCLIYATSNSMPPQYFSRKLGLANGLVKFGGGLGATVLSITLQALITRVGIPWMFRIFGLATLATGLPAAWMIRERHPFPRSALIELSLFRNVAFTAIFLSSAFGTFALFVPPFFLPLFAQSAALSPQTGAALVAGFNACTALGRLFAGPLCDRVGPTNTFLLTMTLNAVSMLAIWPVADSLPTLTVFAVLNGVANGGFFVVLPTTVANIAPRGREAVAMSMNVTGWTAGYLLGTPIAGFLLQASGGKPGVRAGVEVYRPAIFYAGGVALASAVCVLVARVNLERGVRKRV